MRPSQQTASYEEQAFGPEDQMLVTMRKKETYKERKIWPGDANILLVGPLLMA